MLYIYAHLTEEGATFVKALIPEAEVNKNDFMTLELTEAHAYLDLGVSELHIYSTKNTDYKTMYIIPAKYFNTIYNLKND